MYWIPMEFSHPCAWNANVDESMRKWLCDLLLLPSEMLEMKPIVFEVHEKDTQHYFTAAFNYKTRSAYIWGGLIDMKKAGLESTNRRSNGKETYCGGRSHCCLIGLRQRAQCHGGQKLVSGGKIHLHTQRVTDNLEDGT